MRHICDGEIFLKDLCDGCTVAVIGSGPLPKGKGAEIDGHDVVIRINIYDTASRPADTGSRTTCWAHNGHLGSLVPPNNRVPQIVPKWYGGSLVPQFDVMYDYHGVDRMYFFQAETVARLDRLIGEDKALTTGGRILAFLLTDALGVSEVDAYGFSFYDPAKPLFEFANPRQFERSRLERWHDPAAEKVFFVNHVSATFRLHMG